MSKVPTKYNKWDFPKKLYKLKCSGMHDKDIAEKLNISHSTLYHWRKKYSEMEESYQAAVEVLSNKVEESLIQRACGYEVTEVEHRFDKDGKIIEKKTHTKYVNPSVTAMIYWLNNRKPEEWQRNPEIQQNLQTNIQINVGQEDQDV